MHIALLQGLFATALVGGLCIVACSSNDAEERDGCVSDDHCKGDRLCDINTGTCFDPPMTTSTTSANGGSGTTTANGGNGGSGAAGGGGGSGQGGGGAAGGGGGPGGFDDPTSIAGCILWLRADQGVTDAGGQVTDWADQSGSDNHAAQPVDIKRPTLVSDGGPNGTPALDFERAQGDFLELANLDDASVDYTLYVALGQRAATTSLQAILTGTNSGGATNRSLLVVATTLSLLFLDTAGDATVAPSVLDEGGFITCHAAVAGDQWVGFALDATAATLRCNRSDGSEGQAPYGGTWSWGANPPLLGSFSQSTHSIDAAIAEVILYNRVLDSGETQTLETYLNDRYGF